MFVNVYIICGTRQQLTKLDNSSVNIGLFTIHRPDAIRYLGVICNQNMSLEADVNTFCRSSYYQLYNLSRKRKSLTKQATSTCIYAFVTSKLDSCNSLLYGLPKQMIAKLQCVQYATSRALTHHTRCRYHITIIFKDLHWLPLSKCIVYKLLLIKYRHLIT